MRMHKTYLTFVKYFAAFSIVVLSSNTFAGGKIIKWVDKHGVTHYGDRLPTKDSGKKNKVLNNQGVTLKEIDPSKPKHIKTSENGAPKISEQEKRDRALLASYNSAEDIDLARDRNLQLDELALEALMLRMGNAKKKLKSNQEKADGFEKNKKDIPDIIQEDISLNKQEISKTEALIAQRKEIMEDTRRRYDSAKQRFIQLRASNSTPKTRTSQ